MAIADLLVILICVPLASILYTVEYWPWGGTLCRITEGLKDLSIGVSVFTLTALSADRYCAVVNPLRKLQVNIYKFIFITFEFPNLMYLVFIIKVIKRIFVFFLTFEY